MKIRYMSDLHLEFIRPEQIEQFLFRIPLGLDEVCVLAGDIGNPFKSNYNIFMQFIDTNFKKAFVIPGNHEYYNDTHTIEEINTYLDNYFEKFQNISFLNNTVEKYEDFLFIGTTLWSKVTNPLFKINDVDKICELDYISYNRMNMICIDFLEEILDYPSIQKCIVITHHVPSPNLIDVKYKTQHMRPYNQWFACDLEHIIDKHKYKIKGWFYGHTHTPSVETISGVPFLCNPIGYPNENPSVDFNKVVVL